MAGYKAPALLDPADDRAGFGVAIPFADLLGIRVIEQNTERAVLQAALRPDLTNSASVANGGLLMTLLDLAMGAAVRGHLGKAITVLTIDASMSFFAPGHTDLTATGRVLRGGSGIIFGEAEAHDADGTLLAKALGTMKPLLPRQ